MERVPAENFVDGLRAAVIRKDGYIMGSKGQNPKKWKENSWWFTQYDNSRQHAKALYWREHAARVWDCNGLAEGIYEEATGVNINSKARYNYSGWCGIKGAGLIPVKYRIPGAAVFWGNSSGSIHHVAYLDAPVVKDKPDGDWFIIEARGVMYGVVRTSLFQRRPNFWGIMNKYFDYNLHDDSRPINLSNGSRGKQVRILQENLIRLGYDCGRWGADGDFGDNTEMALILFQQDHLLDDDGIYGPKTREAMDMELNRLEEPAEEPTKAIIINGQCWIRMDPSITGRKLGVAHEGSIHPFAGKRSETGWHLIWLDEACQRQGWVSGKYSRLIS